MKAYLTQFIFWAALITALSTNHFIAWNLTILCVLVYFLVGSLIAAICFVIYIAVYSVDPKDFKMEPEAIEKYKKWGKINRKWEKINHFSLLHWGYFITLALSGCWFLSILYGIGNLSFLLMRHAANKLVEKVENNIHSL